MTNETTICRPEIVTDNHLEYLDVLRDSGVNMFGAGAYLRDEFDIDRKSAAVILRYWMHTFSERKLEATITRMNDESQAAQYNLALRRNMRIAELGGTVDFLRSAKTVQKARITELEAQLAAPATIEAAAQPAAWCDDCGMPAEHCRENHAEECAP